MSTTPRRDSAAAPPDDSSSDPDEIEIISSEYVSPEAEAESGNSSDDIVVVESESISFKSVPASGSKSGDESGAENSNEDARVTDMLTKAAETIANIPERGGDNDDDADGIEMIDIKSLSSPSSSGKAPPSTPSTLSSSCCTHGARRRPSPPPGSPLHISVPVRRRRFVKEKSPVRPASTDPDSMAALRSEFLRQASCPSGACCGGKEGGLLSRDPRAYGFRLVEVDESEPLSHYIKHDNGLVEMVSASGYSDLMPAGSLLPEARLFGLMTSMVDPTEKAVDWAREAYDLMQRYDAPDTRLEEAEEILPKERRLCRWLAAAAAKAANAVKAAGKWVASIGVIDGQMEGGQETDSDPN